MKHGAAIAVAVAALFAAGEAAACSRSMPERLTPEEVLIQGEEWARADSVYIAKGRYMASSPCGSVYEPVPAVALKNNLPSGPVMNENGHPEAYGGDLRDDDRIVIFARRVRFSEDWLHWGQWRIIATYRIYELDHTDPAKALAAVSAKPIYVPVN